MIDFTEARITEPRTAWLDHPHPCYTGEARKAVDAHLAITVQIRIHSWQFTYDPDGHIHCRCVYSIT